MGRQAAGEGFLRGFARYAEVERFYCYTENADLAQEFNQIIHRYRDQLPSRSVGWIQHPNHLAGLRQVGALYVPAPGLGEFAWLRRHGDEQDFSLCGITHTTASERATDALTNLLTAPIQPWDALICTSQAVKRATENLLDGVKEYLASRLGATSFLLPQLPVIPLGVDCEKMAFDQTKRQYWRAKLHLSEEEIVFLFVGRLSFHAKAHPLPMYMALEQAARQTGKKMTLIQAGWFANSYIETEFRHSAALCCPSVKCLFVDGRDSQVREGIWFAADIFTSLSDNIQETFGLTPIEAMAARLPCVVSDWNGYRDTVREGIEGFLVPTLMPPPLLGQDIAARFEGGVDNYDAYIGHVAQLVSVDIESCCRAYVTLIENSALRHQMGESGQQRAREIFDWQVIIRRYQALWQELADLREHRPVVAPKLSYRSPNPYRADPLFLFHHYPSQLLQKSHTIRLGTYHNQWQSLILLRLNALASDLLITPKEIGQLLKEIERCPSPVSIEHVLALFPKNRQGIFMRSMTWLSKLGILQIDGEISL